MSQKVRKPPLEAVEATTPRPPQSSPSDIGYGHPEHNFVQGLMTLSQSMARVEAGQEALRKSIADMESSLGSTKAKVDGIQKTIYVATGVVMVLVIIGGWMLNSAKDVALLYMKSNFEAQAAKTAPPPVTPNKIKP